MRSAVPDSASELGTASPSLLLIVAVIIIVVIIIAVPIKCTDAGKSLEIGEHPTDGKFPERFGANGFEVSIAPSTTLHVLRAVPL